MADNTNDNLTVTVQLTSNVAGALLRRFVTWETSSPNFREVITAVPAAATGRMVPGILAEAIDTTLADGFYNSSIVIPGGITEVLCGETITQGAPVRVGGYSAETDGAAYIANATGDVIVGWASQDCTAGNILTFNFVGYAGVI